MARKAPPLYIGTSMGVYLARSRGEDYEAIPLAPIVNDVATIPPTDDPLGWGSRQAARGGIVIDKDNARILYVGTMYDGVFRSEDGGQSWHASHQGLTHKNIWSLRQDPISGHLFAGTQPAALFTSTDGGAHWHEVTPIQSLPRIKEWTFPRAPHVSHIKDIAFGPLGSPSIFCAVEEGWILRSYDGGVSWDNLTEGVPFDAHAVRVMPDDPRIVIVTSGDGFYRSVDDGDSFMRVGEGLDRSYLSAPVLHEMYPETIFLCASAYPPPRWFGPEGNANTAFYRSNDQGRTWRNILRDGSLKAGCFAVAGDPDDPDIFVAGMADGTVWMTSDGGMSLHRIIHNLGVVNCLCVAAVEE